MIRVLRRQISLVPPTMVQLGATADDGAVGRYPDKVTDRYVTGPRRDVIETAQCAIPAHADGTPTALNHGKCFDDGALSERDIG
jgi:hypothetical protein